MGLSLRFQGPIIAFVLILQTLLQVLKIKIIIIKVKNDLQWCLSNATIGTFFFFFNKGQMRKKTYSGVCQTPLQAPFFFFFFFPIGLFNKGQMKKRTIVAFLKRYYRKGLQWHLPNATIGPKSAYSTISPPPQKKKVTLTGFQREHNYGICHRIFYGIFQNIRIIYIYIFKCIYYYIFIFK